MKRFYIIIAITLVLFSMTSSVLNITIEALTTGLRVLLEILSILFSSSGAFMFSAYIICNHVRNDNKDSFNSNRAGHDLIINQHTSVYHNKENDNALVPALNRLTDAIEHKHKENIGEIQNNIKEKTLLTDAPLKQPSEDFMYRYVDNGRVISDKEIQKVWADLYIKEAKNPSSISFRTLDIVKNLTFSEMNLFLNVLNYCIKVGNSGYIPNEICKNVFSLLDITKLGDIGLLKSETTLTWTPTFISSSTTKIISGSLLIIVNNKTTKNIKGSFPVYILTDVGFQLASSINHWIEEENSMKFAKHLRNKNSELEVSIHKIISLKSDDVIQYDPEDMLKKD